MLLISYVIPPGSVNRMGHEVHSKDEPKHYIKEEPGPGIDW